MARESRHISKHIDSPTDEVYAFAADPANLPRWAPGLCTSVEQVDGQWIAASSMGRVVLAFAPANEFGVLDHEVTLPSGQTVHNPMRVLSNDTGCEIVFTLRRQPGVSDDDFERYAEAVLADLTRLEQVIGVG